jgi:hypothetical protein
MDPYLEPHWLDVHGAMVAEARRALNKSLPRGLVARMEERVAIESEEDALQRVGPDVRVFSPSTADPEEKNGGILIEAPYKIVVDLDPLIERFIRVLDQDGQLITIVEFVSPTNKRSRGMKAFRQKRAELLNSGVHFVEIDLVRAGNWRALMRPGTCPRDAVSTYRAVVRTAGSRPGGYLFPIPLRQPLPEVPVPLRTGEEPVKLALQPLLNAVYDDGRYDQALNYSRQLEPAMDPEDAAWADELLRKAGRRR